MSALVTIRMIFIMPYKIESTFGLIINELVSIYRLTFRFRKKKPAGPNIFVPADSMFYLRTTYYSIPNSALRLSTNSLLIRSSKNGHTFATTTPSTTPRSSGVSGITVIPSFASSSLITFS